MHIVLCFANWANIKNIFLVLLHGILQLDKWIIIQMFSSFSQQILFALKLHIIICKDANINLHNFFSCSLFFVPTSYIQGNLCYSHSMENRIFIFIFTFTALVSHVAFVVGKFVMNMLLLLVARICGNGGAK